jgi:hypothetical protein
MEENNTGFSEFAEAFGAGSEYQAAEPEVTEAEEPTTESEEEGVEAQEASENGENTEGANTGEDEEKGTEGAAEPDNPIIEQKFAIKVDGATKEVGIEELKELAQKGGAFDRVKGQLTEARQTVQTLQEENASLKKISGLVSRIAQSANTTPEELLNRVHINWRMQNGETEKEAIANIQAQEASRQLEELKASQKPVQETAQDRAKREVAEFRDVYPDVDLSQELLEKLTPDVQGGMPLLKAYQKLEASRKEAEAAALREEISKLQKQLEAEKQNKKNKASSPGSQKDSGGRRGGGEFDDFLSAFS